MNRRHHEAESFEYFQTVFILVSFRKSRTLIGLTNRPRSVPLGDGVDSPLPNPGDCTQYSNAAVGPVSVTKNRRMLGRIENVRNSLSEYQSPSETWNSRSAQQTVLPFESVSV